MITFIGYTFTVLLVVAVLSRGHPREFLLVALAVLSLNNLVPPYHLLPFKSGRGILLIAVTGASLLYLLAVEMRGGSAERGWVARAVSGYGLGLAALLTVLIGYLIITPSPSYGWVKARNFGVYTVMPTVALSLFAPFRRRELRLVLVVLGICSLLVAAQLALSPQDFGTWTVRKSVGEEVHPNNVARNIGVGMVIVLAALVSARRLGFKELAVLLGSFFILGSISIITGSRGPLLAVAVGVCGYLAFMLRSGPRARILGRVATGLAVGAIVGGVLYNTFLRDQPTLARIILYAATVGQNASDMSRLERYEVAWDGFIDSKLVGVGPGGFTHLWTGPPPGGIFDGRDYPHNFLLEIAVEAGLPGLVIVILTLGSLVGVILIRHRRVRPEALGDAGVFVALWLYALVNSSVSGDVATNYQMWVSGAIVWLIFTRGIEETGEEEPVLVAAVHAGEEMEAAGERV